jgi:hypothetical protein
MESAFELFFEVIEQQDELHRKFLIMLRKSHFSEVIGLTSSQSNIS